MINVNESNFKSTIDNGKLAIIEFSADWCAPCKALKPTLNKLSEEETNVLIGMIDVDDNPDISIEYNIRNVPTTIFFKDGKEVHKIVGNVSKDVFKNKINELNN